VASGVAQFSVVCRMEDLLSPLCRRIASGAPVRLDSPGINQENSGQA